jgi:hypothetical protein
LNPALISDIVEAMNASEPMAASPTDRLRDLTVRFQHSWQAHRDDPQAVDLASFLPPPGDPLRMDALMRLVPLDLEGRWQNGVPLSLEDYVHRFPELGPLEDVPPQLIAEEYRIRAQYGVISPVSVLRQRFPKQYGAVEKLIQADPGRLSAETIVPKSGVMPTGARAVMLAPNLVIGDHYQLNRLIGRGGFGEVWHATDQRGGIDKAIKVLTRAADSEDGQKELESLNIIKKFNHPCVLRTESYFVERDRLFIVLELADATLRDILKKTQNESQTGVPVLSLVAHMKHAAEGLDFLHKQGILHRDIKPENILIVGDYGKIADFGLAKEARNKQSTRADFAGTVVYSAPETWDGRVTTRSDQYSLAATYFELRTGRVLFGGKTFQEVFRKHMEANADLEPIPDLEQKVLRKALSKTPEERFPTCVAFMLALEQAVLASGSKVVESQPPAGPMPTRLNNGETTIEGDAAAPLETGVRVRGGAAPATEAAPQKWNETPHRSRRAAKRSSLGPVVAIVGLLILGGLGAFAVHHHLSKDDAGFAAPDVAIAAAPDIAKPPEPAPPKPVEVTPPKIEKEIPPPLSPAQVKLAEAEKLFAGKEFVLSKEVLDGLGVLNHTDADVKEKGLTLYARLLNDAPFSRDRLRTFDAALVADPHVKTAFSDAMTRRLLEASAEWTDDKKEWIDRVRDCDRIESKNLMIQAIWAEATLESGGTVDQALPAVDDEPPYVSYVRARIAGSQRKHVRAAELIAALPADATPLIGKRAQQAAALLQDGAAELTPAKNGRLQLFASPAEADRASTWHKKALTLLGNQQKALSWHYRLNAALAAACQSDPDFALCKSIGDAVLKDPTFDAATSPFEFDAAKSPIELALVHPAGYPQEFARLRSNFAANDFAPILRLGETQLQTDAKDPDLRARQALLYYAKARALDRNADVDWAKVLEADRGALTLEPKNESYIVAVARATTWNALARAAHSSDDAAGRIKTCERGLADTATAAGIRTAEMWADLGRARSLLYFEIGRNHDWKAPAAKKAFTSAAAAAKEAFAAAPTKAEIAVTWGQAHEALANVCRVDIEKNFEEAVRVYGQAAALEPRYAFERGRCHYRWAMDGDLNYGKSKRDVHLIAALSEFEGLAKIADFSNLAEAGYWEGLTHWDRISRISPSLKAQKAFERSLNAAAKNPSQSVWARYTLPELVALVRKQAKNAPETSAEWLLAVLPAWQTLSQNMDLAKDEGFNAASKDYRDLLAEASFDAAERLLKLKNLDKYRAHMNRAVEMKHSSRHAAFAVTRAVNFKKHEAVLKLTPAEVSSARMLALAALLEADPAVVAGLRKQLDAGAPP